MCRRLRVLISRLIGTYSTFYIHWQNSAFALLVFDSSSLTFFCCFLSESIIVLYFTTCIYTKGLDFTAFATPLQQSIIQFNVLKAHHCPVVRFDLPPIKFYLLNIYISNVKTFLIWDCLFPYPFFKLPFWYKNAAYVLARKSTAAAWPGGIIPVSFFFHI